MFTASQTQGSRTLSDYVTNELISKNGMWARPCAEDQLLVAKQFDFFEALLTLSSGAVGSSSLGGGGGGGGGNSPLTSSPLFPTSSAGNTRSGSVGNHLPPAASPVFSSVKGGDKDNYTNFFSANQGSAGTVPNTTADSKTAASGSYHNNFYQSPAGGNYLSRRRSGTNPTNPNVIQPSSSTLHQRGAGLGIGIAGPQGEAFDSPSVGESPQSSDHHFFSPSSGGPRGADGAGIGPSSPSSTTRFGNQQYHNNGRSSSSQNHPIISFEFGTSPPGIGTSTTDRLLLRGVSPTSKRPSPSNQRGASPSPTAMITIGYDGATPHFAPATDLTPAPSRQSSRSSSQQQHNQQTGGGVGGGTVGVGGRSPPLNPNGTAAHRSLSTGVVTWAGDGDVVGGGDSDGAGRGGSGTPPSHSHHYGPYSNQQLNTTASPSAPTFGVSPATTSPPADRPLPRTISAISVQSEVSFSHSHSQSFVNYYSNSNANATNNTTNNYFHSNGGGGGGVGSTYFQHMSSASNNNFHNMSIVSAASAANAHNHEPWHSEELEKAIISAIRLVAGRHLHDVNAPLTPERLDAICSEVEAYAGSSVASAAAVAAANGQSLSSLAAPLTATVLNNTAAPAGAAGGGFLVDSSSNNVGGLGNADTRQASGGSHYSRFTAGGTTAAAEGGHQVHYSSLSPNDNSAGAGGVVTITSMDTVNNAVAELSIIERCDFLQVGMTPLMAAVAMGLDRVVDVLLREFRASVHIQNALTGETAVHVACRLGRGHILSRTLLPLTPFCLLIERAHPQRSHFTAHLPPSPAITLTSQHGHVTSRTGSLGLVAGVGALGSALGGRGGGGGERGYLSSSSAATSKRQSPASIAGIAKSASEGNFMLSDTENPFCCGASGFPSAPTPTTSASYGAGFVGGGGAAQPLTPAGLALKHRHYHCLNAILDFVATLDQPGVKAREVLLTCLGPNYYSTYNALNAGPTSSAGTTNAANPLGSGGGGSSPPLLCSSSSPLGPLPPSGGLGFPLIGSSGGLAASSCSDLPPSPTPPSNIHSHSKRTAAKEASGGRLTIPSGGHHQGMDASSGQGREGGYTSGSSRGQSPAWSVGNGGISFIGGGPNSGGFGAIMSGGGGGGGARSPGATSYSAHGFTFGGSHHGASSSYMPCPEGLNILHVLCRRSHDPQCLSFFERVVHHGPSGLDRSVVLSKDDFGRTPAFYCTTPNAARLLSVIVSGGLGFSPSSSFSSVSSSISNSAVIAATREAVSYDKFLNTPLHVYKGEPTPLPPGDKEDVGRMPLRYGGINGARPPPTSSGDKSHAAVKSTTIGNNNVSSAVSGADNANKASKSNNRNSDTLVLGGGGGGSSPPMTIGLYQSIISGFGTRGYATLRRAQLGITTNTSSSSVAGGGGVVGSLLSGGLDSPSLSFRGGGGGVNSGEFNASNLMSGSNNTNNNNFDLTASGSVHVDASNYADGGEPDDSFTISGFTRAMKEVLIRRLLQDASASEEDFVACLTTLHTNASGIPVLHAMAADAQSMAILVRLLTDRFCPSWQVVSKLCRSVDQTPRGHSLLHHCAANGYYDSLQVLLMGTSIPLNRIHDTFIARSQQIAETLTCRNRDGLPPMFMTAHCPAAYAGVSASVLLLPCLELLKAAKEQRSGSLMFALCRNFVPVLKCVGATLYKTHTLHYYAQTGATEAFRGWRKTVRALIKNESSGIGKGRRAEDYPLQQTLAKMAMSRDHVSKLTAIAMCIYQGNVTLLGYLIRSILACTSCQVLLEALAESNRQGELSSFFSSSASIDRDVTAVTPKKAPRFSFPTPHPDQEQIDVIHSMAPPEDLQSAVDVYSESFTNFIIPTWEAITGRTTEEDGTVAPHQSLYAIAAEHQRHHEDTNYGAQTSTTYSHSENNVLAHSLPPPPHEGIPTSPSSPIQHFQVPTAPQNGEYITTSGHDSSTAVQPPLLSIGSSNTVDGFSEARSGLLSNVSHEDENHQTNNKSSSPSKRFSRSEQKDDLGPAIAKGRESKKKSCGGGHGGGGARPQSLHLPRVRDTDRGDRTRRGSLASQATSNASNTTAMSSSPAVVLRKNLMLSLLEKFYVLCAKVVKADQEIVALTKEEAEARQAIEKQLTSAVIYVKEHHPKTDQYPILRTFHYSELCFPSTKLHSDNINVRRRAEYMSADEFKELVGVDKATYASWPDVRQISIRSQLKLTAYAHGDKPKEIASTPNGPAAVAATAAAAQANNAVSAFNEQRSGGVAPLSSSEGDGKEELLSTATPNDVAFTSNPLMNTRDLFSPATPTGAASAHEEALLLNNAFHSPTVATSTASPRPSLSALMVADLTSTQASSPPSGLEGSREAAVVAALDSDSNENKAATTEAAVFRRSNLPVVAAGVMTAGESGQKRAATDDLYEPDESYGSPPAPRAYTPPTSRRTSTNTEAPLPSSGQ